MVRFVVTLVITCLLFSWAQADEEYAPENLPTVSERVDSIIILWISGNRYGHVIFVRNNQVMATRLLLDDMVFTISDGEFLMSWEDRSTCWRDVRAKSYMTVRSTHDPFQDGRAGPWWGMNRNMRDLRKPE